MSDFISQYYLDPIRDTSLPSYNWVNTITYGVLALIAAFLIYKFIEKKKITVDKWFFFAILPFIAFGSVTHVLEDGRWLPRLVQIFGFETYPFVTPYIYVLTFLLVVASALVAHVICKEWGEKLKKTTGLIGWLIVLPFVIWLLFYVKHLELLFIWLVALAGLFAIYCFIYQRMFKTSELSIVSFLAQCSDAVATYLGIKFAGYSEQHVVGNLILGVGGSELFLVVKVAFAFLVIYVVENDVLDVRKKNYVYLLITIFGLAPGLRDILRIAAGV